MAAYPLARPIPSRVTVQSAGTSLLLALGILVGVAIVALFAHSLVAPYLGTDASLQNGEWRVNRADENGTAFRDGIRAGDRVIKINGVRPEDLAPGLDYIGAHQAHGLEVTDASGQPKSSSAEVGPVPDRAVQESIGFFTVCAAFWIVGFLSFLKKPGSRPVLLLYLMSLVLAVAPMASLDSVRGGDVSRHLEVITFIVAPWLVIRFFLDFPFVKRIRPLGKDVTGLVYLPPVLLSFVYLLVGHEDQAFYQWFRPVILADFLAGFVLAVVVVLHSYFTATFARFKQQSKMVLIGAAISILPLIISGVLPESLGVGYLLPPAVTTLAFVALPVSLGYVILTHKLLDIDQAISRITWYGLLACALVAAYVFFLGITEALLPGLGSPWRVAMLAVFTVIALASSGHARASLRQGVEARLNRGRYDYRRASHELIADLASKTELVDVARLLAVDISRFLKLEGACVLLDQDGKSLAAAAAHGNFHGDSGRLGKLKEACRDLSEDQAFPNQAPAGSGAAFLVPLSRGEKQLGILALSAKTSGSDFSVDDNYFIFSIQTQGSLVVDNALLLEQTKKHALELEDALTHQREYASYLENSRRVLEQSYVNIVRTLVLAVESRSPYTKGHSDRVTQVARRIGANLGLPAEELNLLQIAGRIHDIGKIGTPDSILLKSGPLEHHERAEIELHPTKGVEIVRFLDFLRDVVPIVESHHEWFNGEGYPSGLRGDDIPVGARILAVADAFDAMTSDRPYRKACTCEEALERLSQGSGTQWDPKIVEAVACLPDLDDGYS